MKSRIAPEVEEVDRGDRRGREEDEEKHRPREVLSRLPDKAKRNRPRDRQPPPVRQRVEIRTKGSRGEKKIEEQGRNGRPEFIPRSKERAEFNAIVDRCDDDEDRGW